MWVTKRISGEGKDDFVIEYLNVKEFSKYIIIKRIIL
tara:strand:+ start:227 stop:337 length:111 start_codon:yes stop_codon:yes gene_type:complete